jgi:hypothetical protein
MLARHAETALLDADQKGMPGFRRILEDGDCRVLGVADEDLAIGDRYLHAVTVSHTAASLPPCELLKFHLSKRH